MNDPKPELLYCYACRTWRPRGECSPVRHGDTDHWICRRCALVHRRRAAR